MQASISVIQNQRMEKNTFAKQISTIFDSVDGKWVVDAMSSSMKLHELAQKEERMVRIPQTLIEPNFLCNLRSGVAVSSLHCLSFLNRFNHIMEKAIDDILLGKLEFH